MSINTDTESKMHLFYLRSTALETWPAAWHQFSWDKLPVLGSCWFHNWVNVLILKLHFSHFEQKPRGRGPSHCEISLRWTSLFWKVETEIHLHFTRHFVSQSCIKTMQFEWWKLKHCKSGREKVQLGTYRILLFMYALYVCSSRHVHVMSCHEPVMEQSSIV